MTPFLLCYFDNQLLDVELYHGFSPLLATGLQNLFYEYSFQYVKNLSLFTEQLREGKGRQFF